jgi:hypothetical protein
VKERREPKAVRELIDKHLVQGQLTRMGLLKHLFGPVEMRPDHRGGTRRQDRDR